MYDMPSTDNLANVVDEGVILGDSEPLLIYESEKKLAAPSNVRFARFIDVESNVHRLQFHNIPRCMVVVQRVE